MGVGMGSLAWVSSSQLTHTHTHTHKHTHSHIHTHAHTASLPRPLPDLPSIVSAAAALTDSFWSLILCISRGSSRSMLLSYALLQARMPSRRPARADSTTYSTRSLAPIRSQVAPSRVEWVGWV